MFIKKTSSPEARRGFSPPMRAWAGFSLLELLMVLTLAPIVFFALYSSFSAGLRVWSTVVRQTPEEDLHIFYTKTHRDIENMLRAPSIPMAGESEEASFACAIEAPAALGGSRGIGQVRLFYDRSAKTINREVKNYSQMQQGSGGQTTILLKDVSEFSFSYLSAGQTGGYSWNDSWTPQPGALPVALRLTFTAKDFPGKQERIIYVPVGGVIR